MSTEKTWNWGYQMRQDIKLWDSHGSTELHLERDVVPPEKSLETNDIHMRLTDGVALPFRESQIFLIFCVLRLVWLSWSLWMISDGTVSLCEGSSAEIQLSTDYSTQIPVSQTPKIKYPYLEFNPILNLSEMNLISENQLIGWEFKKLIVKIITVLIIWI